MSSRKIPALQEQPDDLQAFLVGVDSDKTPKIVKFSPKTNKFSQIPFPSSMQIFNQCSVTWADKENIVISGGLDPTGKASNLIYMYNVATNKV